MMTSALSSQRFCLRWNNHQSNLLTVFDQLLHDESFVDVTLAVEGRLLKAHKMVLSACSPYFQALFVGHPDKHPIVILKDVPYCDMKSLLDFMYRGEVSVDQERLTAFLKVAESLRIKGLTEVNEEKYDLPSIASSLLSSVPPPVVTTHTPPPPPHLHRIHPIPSHRRNLTMPSATPLLGSALTAPKRKRGRPRKLSGSNGGAAGAQAAATAADSAAAQKTSTGNGEVDNSARLAQVPDPVVTQGSPEMLEVRMSVDFQQSGASGGRPPDGEIGNDTAAMATEPSSDQADTQDKESTQPPAKKIKEELEPTPGPSSQDPGEVFSGQSGTTDSEQLTQETKFASVFVEETPSITFELCGQEQVFHAGPGAIGLMDESVEDSKMGLVVQSLDSAPGVHFLSHEAEDGGHECILVTKCEDADTEDVLMEGAGRGRQELLEYLVRDDGSVVCKWCGEVLPTRTHWYRHKYKFHVAATFQPPASLYKCHRCNVFFKSRKGYTGHVANRHAEGEEQERKIEVVEEELPVTPESELLSQRQTRRTRGSEVTAQGDEYQSQREKEEKLVADIIDRVRRECEAQGATVTRRGYSRRSTVMNS